MSRVLLCVPWLSLLLLACGPKEYQTNSPYHRGPAIRLEQRYQGEEGINTTPIRLRYEPRTIENLNAFQLRLDLSAFDHTYDEEDRLSERTIYQGSGENPRLASYSRYAYDQFGRYEQLDGEANGIYEARYDSVARSLPPDYPFLVSRHYYGWCDSRNHTTRQWKTDSFTKDSVVLIPSKPAITIRMDSIVSWQILLDSVSEQQTYIVHSMLTHKKRISYDTLVVQSDSMLLQWRKWYRTIPWRPEMEIYGLKHYSIRDYDHHGRLIRELGTAFGLNDSTWETSLYHYDSVPASSSEVNTRRYFTGEWQTDVEEDVWIFDEQGRLSTETEYLTTNGQRKKVFAKQYEYAEDQRSITVSSLSYGEKLDQFERFYFDQYGNGIGFERQTGFLEGHRRDSVKIKLVNLQYDQYGNWTEADFQVSSPETTPPYHFTSYSKISRKFTYRQD